MLQNFSVSGFLATNDNYCSMKSLICSKRISSPIFPIYQIYIINVRCLLSKQYQKSLEMRQIVRIMIYSQIIFKQLLFTTFEQRITNTMDFVIEQSVYECRQTPQPYALESHEQAIIQHVLRLSLESENDKTYSKANALSRHHYQQIKSMKMGKSKQQCSVCMHGFEKDQIIKRLPCGHILHKQCAKGWLKVNRRCPLCRLDLEQHFQKSEQHPVQQELLL